MPKTKTPKGGKLKKIEQIKELTFLMDDDFLVWFEKLYEVIDIVNGLSEKVGRLEERTETLTGLVLTMSKRIDLAGQVEKLEKAQAVSTSGH